MKAILPYKMTSKEKKAMLKEINRQAFEADKKISIDFDSVVLWTLHEDFGFGEKRLKRFWDSFFRERQKLIEYYQLDPGANGWICRKKLKEIGIDIEEWQNESCDDG